MLPFTGFVLVEGSVAPFEFVKLAGLFVAAAVLIATGACIALLGFELVRSGLRSNWQEPPRSALLNAVKARWADDRLFSMIWPIALFLVLLPAFNAFKQRILPNAGFVYDETLAGLDRSLFGTDPGLVLHGLIGSPSTTIFFDALYHSWFVPTTLGLCFVGACAGVRTRAQYMLSYVLVWLFLGALLAFVFPAGGPAFFAQIVGPADAAPFLAVQGQLAAAGQTQFLTSLANQDYLISNLDAPKLVVGGGISAIPSIHNAMAVLFAVASFRFHWMLGAATSLFAVLIWIASVYLNWHYAVDGIAGAAGAILIWFASGAVVDRLLALVDRQQRGRTAGLRPIQA